MRASIKHRWAGAIVAVAAIFVLSLTLSCAVHQHKGTNEAACPICHLNHQSTDIAPIPVPEISLQIVGQRDETPEPTFHAQLRISRLPARAPPIA
jgi:hypothetical protein